MSGQRWAIGLLLLTTAMYVAGLALVLASGDGLGLNELLLPFVYAFAVVGFLIAINRPGNKIAWICLGVGLVWGLEALLGGLVVYGVAHPGSVPWIGVFAALGIPLWIPGIFGAFILIFLLFPDGRVPSPGWRWLSWLAGLGVLWWYLFTVFSEPEPFGFGRPAVESPLAILHPFLEDNGWVAAFEMGAFAIFGALGASAVALVSRYRRSVGLERQQLKWLAWAGATVTAIFTTTVLLLTDLLGEDAGLVAAGSFVLIPISIGVAVLRYRLYDIDRLVSRTVSYALVAGLLAGVFSAIVIGVPQLIGASDNSPAVVAGATLAAAALFSPLLRRVQGVVDRRFNRTQYDAMKEMEFFAEQLRNEVNATELADEVLDVVAKTMQPASASLWIRHQRGPLRKDGSAE